MVTDGLASWNQGDFLVSWHEGETTCERVEDNQSINVVELDINTLTALMMGYKRPTYLYHHEKISMEYYMLTWLERRIPVKKPYFSESANFCVGLLCLHPEQEDAVDTALLGQLELYKNILFQECIKQKNCFMV